MAVVVDSTMLTCLISGDGRAGIVSRQFVHWFRNNEALHAPALLSFEVADFLTRLVTSGRLSHEQVRKAWSDLGGLPINYHVLKDWPRIVEIAVVLGDRKGFDAAYLALGEELDSPLWTLNNSLFRRASKSGFRVAQPSRTASSS